MSFTTARIGVLSALRDLTIQQRARTAMCSSFRSAQTCLGGLRNDSNASLLHVSGCFVVFWRSGTGPFELDAIGFREASTAGDEKRRGQSGIDRKFRYHVRVA